MAFELAHLTMAVSSRDKSAQKTADDKRRPERNYKKGGNKGSRNYKGKL
jgi:hypothetical protein